VPPPTLRRFWMMLAHYHGQIFNASEIGRSLGVSSTSVRNYLDILTGTFMVRELKPWAENNLHKRQVKSPKIYFRDSGIFHTLIGINHKDELRIHPKLGASWEGFAIEQVMVATRADSENAYFWATHTGAELDLFINDFGRRRGFEFKYGDAPKLTPSMKNAMEDLSLEHLTVIYPGNRSYSLAEEIEVIGLRDFVMREKEIHKS
jgi:predicted AAA+ superfamily ATPase